VLVIAAIAVGLIAQLASVVQEVAIRFEDQAGYNATVLAGAHIAHPVALAAAEPTRIAVFGVLAGVGSTIGAVILALLALYRRRMPLLRRGYEPGAGLATPIQRFQSGVVNDYVTWIVLGLACVGGVLALAIRLRRDQAEASRAAALSRARWDSPWGMLPRNAPVAGSIPPAARGRPR
jgi:hypothetical protein